MSLNENTKESDYDDMMINYEPGGNAEEVLSGEEMPPTSPLPQHIPNWLMIFSMCSISILAVIGNMLVIFCFVKFRKTLKQNTVAYLISLAISDLWIGFMTGCGVLAVVYKRWVLGEFLCQAIAFLNNVALVNSLWTVAIGSVDRCFAIRIPLKYRSVMTQKRLIALIIGTWCYACALSLPPLIQVAGLSFSFHPSHPWCAMSSRYNVVYFLAFSIGFLPFPIIIIITSYIVIFITTQLYTKRQLERLTMSPSPTKPISTDPTDSVSGLQLTTLFSGGGSLGRRRSAPGSTAVKRCNSDRATYPCYNDKVVRLSDTDVVALNNISSSYDTLRITRRGSNWSTQKNMILPPENKPLWKKLANAVRSMVGMNKDAKAYSAMQPNKHISTAMCEEEASARKLQSQAGTLLVVIGSTIILSYTPLLSISTLAAFHYNVRVEYKQVQGFTLLMLSNAAINPLIYFLLNKEFRVAAKTLFNPNPVVKKLRRRGNSNSFSTRGSYFSTTSSVQGDKTNSLKANNSSSADPSRNSTETTIPQGLVNQSFYEVESAI